MNNVTLMGRLTRDPQFFPGKEGKSAVARYTIAVDRRRTANGERATDFISCVSFGRTAEFVSKYLKKGTKVTLSGRIQTGQYKDQQGSTHYTTDVVAENIEFAESKRAADAAAAQPAYQQGYQQPQQQAYQQGYGQPQGYPQQQGYQSRGVDNDVDNFINLPEGGIDEELPFSP